MWRTVEYKGDEQTEGGEMALRSSVLLTLHIVKLTIKKDEVNRMCGNLREGTYICRLVIGIL